MLRFFRNIRQKLLENGNLRKYFWYALGEILLVVIGILIALQINNWNEERKMRERESFYLKELKVDFERNRMEAKSLVQFSKNQVANINLLLDSMNNPDQVTDHTLWFTALNHAWFLPHPVFVDNAWTQLQSTGNLTLIKNDTLIREIGDFYQNVESMNKLEDEWSAFHLVYRSKVNELIEIDLRDTIMESMSDSGVNGLEDSPDSRLYIIKMKEIEGIRGALSDIEINRGGSVVGYELLQDKSLLIIERIEEELKRLDP
jgi:hypothetical protein